VSSILHAVAELAGLIVVILGPVPLAVLFAECAGAGFAAERMLALLVGWCALQTALAIGLAMTGFFALAPLLMSEGMLFGVGAHFAHRVGSRAGSDLGPARGRDPYASAILWAIVVLGVDLALRLVSQPLVDHDSLGYHLPALARWVQAGALVPLDRTDQIAHYPYSWELLAALFVLPVGQDVLVAAPNLVAWTILGLAVVAGARRLGAPTPHAFAAALCLLALEVTRATMHSLHVDIALVAFFASCVAFALASNPAGWATGLALLAGTKMSGIPLAGLGFAAGVLLGIGASIPRRALPVVLPALGVGIFWYARNLLETGNPLGLLHLAVHGTTVLPGSVESAALARTTLASRFDPGDPSHRDILGRLLAAKLGLPGLLLFCGSLGLMRKEAHAARRPVVVVLGLVIACTLLYVTTPFSAVLGLGSATLSRTAVGENLRYALPAFAMLALTGAVGGAHLVGPVGALAAAILAAVDSTSIRTLPAAMLVMLGATIVTLIRVAPRRVTSMVIFAASVALVGSWSWLCVQRDAARTRAYGAAVEWSVAALPAGTVIAHPIKSNSYPLYGPRFTNRVRYVPAVTPHREQWLRALRDAGASIVALGPLTRRQEQRPEVRWLTDRDGPFLPIAGIDPRREVVLYRLR
jgi:hypothetical protein